MVMCFQDVGTYMLLQAEDGLLPFRCADRCEPYSLHDMVCLKVGQAHIPVGIIPKVGLPLLSLASISTVTIHLGRALVAHPT